MKEIQVKRVYEKAQSRDGIRVLVDRIDFLSRLADLCEKGDMIIYAQIVPVILKSHVSSSLKESGFLIGKKATLILTQS